MRFKCSDEKDVPADVNIVAALSTLVRNMLTTSVGVVRDEDGAYLLPVPATSAECLIALAVLYNFEPHERLLSGGFDALPGVVAMAMYIDAPTVVQFILSWASDVVGDDNAPDVLRFAITVAVRRELCPDLQQRIMRLAAEALQHIGWSCLILNSDSDSVEALGTLLAIDFNTLSELLWSIFVDSRTDPCTGFIGFLVLWARHRPLRLVDVATLILKLSDEHEPFARALYQICVSEADLRQIQTFVFDHVSDHSSQLLLMGTFTGYPRLRSQRYTPVYDPTSPAYDEDVPQTPGYAPHDDEH